MWLGACSIASAQCSRPISLAYTTPEIRQAFSGHPGANLPTIEEALGKESGCEIRLASYPTARLWHEYFNGNLDVALGAIESPRLDATGIFVPMDEDEWILITARNPSSVPKHLEDFLQRRDLLVGTIHGGVQGPRLDGIIEALRQQGQIDEFTDLHNGLEKLLLNRDAALLTDVSHIEYVLSPRRFLALKLHSILQSQFLPTVIGIYLNKLSLGEKDRDDLQKAITSPAVQDQMTQLRRERLRELDENNGGGGHDELPSSPAGPVHDRS